MESQKLKPASYSRVASATGRFLGVTLSGALVGVQLGTLLVCAAALLVGPAPVIRLLVG